MTPYQRPHHRPMTLPLALALALLALTSAAPAQSMLTPAPQNVVALSAQASVDITQDLLAINLQATREGTDAAVVQSQLRQALDNALAEARKAQRPGQVDVRTGAFSIYPRYANKPNGTPTINGWQGTAELVLEGRDMGAISSLAGRLTGMTVSQVQHGLSREAREQAEADVSAQAIRRFQARAEAYAKGFGFAGYSLREVTVSGDGVAQPRPMAMMRMRAAAAPMADESQPVAPGQTTVTVTVSGSVQMSPR